MKLTDVEKYEIRAEAFRIMTGYMAPGKDASALAHQVPYQERSAAFNEWITNNRHCVNAMMLAFEHTFEHILPSDLRRGNMRNEE